VQELVERIGQEEAAFRSGLTVQTLWRIRNRKVQYVRKHTAHLVIITLYQVRKEMRFHNIAWASQETARRRLYLERLMGY